MTANLTLIERTGRTAGFPQMNAMCPSRTRTTAVSTFHVSLTLVFIGKAGSAEWTQLSDAIRCAFGDTIEIITVASIARLRVKGAKHADIVFVKGTRTCCSAKTRLEISEVCPLASAIYVTTGRKGSDIDQADRDIICVGKDQPIALDQVFGAVFEAMRRRICCLKLALLPAAPDAMPASSLIERLFLLTHQESRILANVRQGMPNKTVAKQLNITVRTVKAHLTEIFRKTGLTQRAELIVRCNELSESCAASARDESSDPKRKDRGSLPFPRRSAPRASLPAGPSIPSARLGKSETIQPGTLCHPIGQR